VSEKKTLEELPGLALKDRLNHPYLLAKAILSFVETCSNQQATEGQVREAVMTLFDLIPELWEDDAFHEDVKKARTVRILDVRPNFCGQKATVEWCAAEGVPAVQKIAIYNHHLLLKACVNLLERRALLSRKVLTEILLGEKYDEVTADEVETLTSV